VPDRHDRFNWSAAQRRDKTVVSEQAGKTAENATMTAAASLNVEHSLSGFKHYGIVPGTGDVELLRPVPG